MPALDEYKEKIERFDFREAKVWGENADRYFADVDEMTKWIDQPSIVPFLKHVEKIDKQSFRDTVVEKMVEETLRADGRCFETFRRINVFNIK